MPVHKSTNNKYTFVSVDDDEYNSYYSSHYDNYTHYN